jgi:UDP-4-amino-4-deoxy-L-arabinose-oxoglutarate aminotransferase
LLDPHGGRERAIERLEHGLFDRAPFSDIQATIGLAQMQRIDDFSRRRSIIAERFLAAAPDAASERLRRTRDAPWGSMLRMPFESTKSFSELQTHFAGCGIALRQGVDQLAHRACGLSDAAFPNSIRAFTQTVSVPFYPALSDAEGEQVAAALRSLL